MTIDEPMTSDELRAPFPWFGGKRKVADLVWSRLGDVQTYNEPFAGSLAVLLGRPHVPRVETVNDLDCVVPDTRILKADMSWARATDLRVGDTLIGFDEQNGPARAGLRAPTRYRRMAKSIVTGIRILEKPCYRLTFDDGTEVTASANHLWLGGSHKSGGRGWRWVKTENMVCNRESQRPWVLKVCEVTDREDSWEAGWIGGILDGEGSLKTGPGLRITLAQNEGAILDRAESLMAARGVIAVRTGKRRCKQVQLNGGLVKTFSALMRFRPTRLIDSLGANLHRVSLYGRTHRAVGLVKKEFVGHRCVIAIETDTRTFIAEGLASHNCYLANFWRAVKHDPEGVAKWSDSPVNEADLHANHRWLVETARERAERVMTDPDFFDVQIAGRWVHGQCLWIGSGWCQRNETTGRAGYGVEQYLTGEQGVIRSAASRSGENPSRQRKRQAASRDGESYGVHKKRFAGVGNDSGAGVHAERSRRWQGGGQGGGSGVHAPTLTRQKPELRGDAGATGSGIHASGFDRRYGNRFDASAQGHGINAQCFELKSGGLYTYMHQLAARLRRVRVCCGDWRRVLTPSVTTYVGTCGVFLDPPYQHDMRERCYSEDHDVSGEVCAWALANGDNPDFRIALCGYEGEHEMPDSWECVPWKAHGGYSRTKRGVENRSRERIWFSPHCLRPADRLPFDGTAQ